MNVDLKTWSRRIDIANEMYKKLYDKDLDLKSKELLATCLSSINDFYNNFEFSQYNSDLKRSHLNYMTCIFAEGNFPEGDEIFNFDHLYTDTNNDNNFTYVKGFVDGVNTCSERLFKHRR